MKSLLHLSTGIILLLLLLRPTFQDCSNGCIQCENNQCLVCNKHTATHGKHGDQCSKEPAPAEDHCTLYKSHMKCHWCDEEWASDLINEGICSVKHGIENCVQGVSVRGMFVSLSCEVCKEGFPDVDTYSCNGWTENELQGPAQNCLWGARNLDTQQPYCVRCTEGYMIVKGGCVESKFEGCWKSDVLQKGCEVCDPWLGYEMLSGDEKCTKSSEKGDRRIGNGISLSKYFKDFKDRVAKAF